MTRADLPLAAGVIALGVLLFAGIREIGPGAGYDRVGPRFFPLAVAAGFVLLGTALGVAAAWRRPGDETTTRAEAAALRLDWLPLAYLSAACVLFVALLERVGFVAAGAVQFWLVARAFRSRKPARDAVVAVLLSLIVYLAFSNGLGLALPEGLLVGLL